MGIADHITSRAVVLGEVADERRRQDDKWGYPQRNSKPMWMSIILEEFGEVAQLVNDIELSSRRENPNPNHRHPSQDALEEELVQAAACIVAFLEHLRGGHA